MDIEKDSDREAFEAIAENIRLLRGAKFKDGEYVALSLFDESSKELAAQLNYGWAMWLSAKNQAVPDGFVVVPKELPEQIAEKMAIDRIDKPRHENDPVWSKIAEQSYKDKVKFKKWEFWRDYKAMIEAQESANE